MGARFKGTNRRGVARWSTTPTVEVADPGREFAFLIRHLGHDATRWTYRFEALADGTEVTESFETLQDLPWYFRLADRLLMGVTDRQADLETNLQETLRRLKAVAEGQQVRGLGLRRRGARGRYCWADTVRCHSPRPPCSLSRRS